MIASAAPQSASNGSRPAGTSVPLDPHEQFLKFLPSIRINARIAFRRLRCEAREEAVQEVICNAFAAFMRLAEQGRTEVACAGSLGRFAIAQFRDGRRVGCRLNIRDITSTYCQRRKGVRVERLDQWNEEEESWQEILVEDKTCTPAELAASRIDFIAWLATLSVRDRQVANLLASGESTTHVSEKFGLSPSRISQLRRELQESWWRFHEPVRDLAAAVAA